MSVGSGGWFVRGGGRVLGPFNWSQLETLRDRGRLSPLHELSQDRRSWIKATELRGLYTPAGAGPGQPSTTADVEWPTSTVADGAGGGPAAQVAGSCAVRMVYRPRGYSSRAAEPRGAATVDGRRRVRVEFLVWTNGMANWLPAAQVSGLRFAPSAPARGRTRSPAPRPRFISPCAPAVWRWPAWCWDCSGCAASAACWLPSSAPSR